MGAAASSDPGCIVRCCAEPQAQHLVHGREANRSLIEVANCPSGAVVRIDDPVDGTVRLLKEADDLTQRSRLAHFASRSDPWEGCVGHCGISPIKDASGRPLTR